MILEIGPMCEMKRFSIPRDSNLLSELEDLFLLSLLKV